MTTLGVGTAFAVYAVGVVVGFFGSFVVRRLPWDSTERVARALDQERQRHDRAMAQLLARASAVGLYVPGTNPFLFPGTGR